MRTDPSIELPARDEAVRAATGKGWDEWFRLLDEAGAERKSHREIVAHLSRAHAVGPWWRQMVTVGYERARGLRAKHQRPDGYSVSASRTIAVPVDRLFETCADDGRRGAWLDGIEFTIRKTTRPKVIRAAGPDGTAVDLHFQAKGAAKSQVTVDQRRIADADGAGRFKAMWRERLAALKASLEA